jgi:hypothetical protein
VTENKKIKVGAKYKRREMSEAEVKRLWYAKPAAVEVVRAEVMLGSASYVEVKGEGDVWYIPSAIFDKYYVPQK